MNTNLKRIIFIIMLIIVWEVIFRLQIWPQILFPSPSRVGQTFVNGFISGRFITALSYSFRRLLIGYLIAVFLGTFLGFLIAIFKTVEETLGYFILALQSIPSIAWLPLAILWFRMGEAAIIFVIVLGGTWNMVIESSSGIKNVDPLLIKAAKTMGLDGTRLFTKVILPASVPHLITGMRISWAFSWRALLAGELLGSGNGLGYVLMWGQETGNMSLVISVMIIIASLGIITDNIIFQPLENKVLQRWGF